MDKEEVIKSLAKMFQETEESDYVIEEKQIDRNTYLSLVARNREEQIQTHPDYDAFVSILQYCNSKTLNYVVKRLNDNKRKFFVEYTDAEKEKFLNNVRDYYKRVVGANAKSLTLLESMIVEWVDDLLK
jgi:Mg/Co/Ni transporter MgtE